MEILKGSLNKKVMDNNHQNTPYFGRLKSWNKNDVLRLLHKLVIEEYLKEDIIFFNDIPQAYLKIGPKIEKLINKQIQIVFAVKEVKATKAKDIVTVTSSNDTAANKQLKDLKERCYNDLLEICRNIAAQKNVAMASIMNMQALKAMADKLPESKNEMLALPHVTAANFVKYGQELLEITQNYAAEKLCKFLFKF